MKQTNINFNQYGDIFKALGHPVRLQIISGLITHGECNVNKIVDNLKLPQSTVSQHLAILKNKGIIEPKKYGVKTCYKVINEKIKNIIKILNQ